MNRDEVLLAIVKVAGYDSIEDFKWVCENTKGIEDYWLGGMLSAVHAVEKLYDEKDGQDGH